MAADLIMPTLPDHQVQSQYFAAAAQPVYHGPRPHLAHARSQSQQQFPTSSVASSFYSQHQQYYSQQPSPLSSGQGSPTSPEEGPRAPGPRQNRPLFMPAVLRPTQYPSKLPRSPRNEDGPEGVSLALRRSSGSIINLPGLSDLIGSRLSRRSTGDSGKEFVDSDLDWELFPEVNGLPTRKHWKPDPQASICDEPNCRRGFTYFTRRHHCRKCGNIFCDSHSAFAIPLDQDCNYNPRGSASRSCGHCFSEFIAWKSRNNSRESSDQGSTVDGPNSAGVLTGATAASAASSSAAAAAAVAASKSTPASPINAGSPATASPTVRHPEVAASVPRDWNWSTF